MHMTCFFQHWQQDNWDENDTTQFNVFYVAIQLKDNVANHSPKHWYMHKKFILFLLLYSAMTSIQNEIPLGNVRNPQI